MISHFNRFLFVVTLATSSVNAGLSTYYTGSGNLQYFVSPTKFKSSTANMLIDFTYLNTPDKSKNVICNFTVTTATKMLDISHLLFFAGSDTIYATSVKLMFAEQSKKNYRYTSEITPDQFQKLLNSSTKIEIITETNHIIFNETKNSKKSFKLAQQDILFPANPNQ